MLDGLEKHRPSFANPSVATLAVVFHDVVYDPARQDNEAQSAVKMETLLSGHVDNRMLKLAAAQILATQQHRATDDQDTNLLLDLDMAVLAQPWPIYLRYAQGVEREYASLIPEFARLRAEKFLTPLLESGKIFITQKFAPLNAAALHNVERERDMLLNRNTQLLSRG